MATNLKQFEKWLKVEGFDKNGKGFQEGYKRAMELAWIAALKWIESINTGEAYNTVDQAIYEELGDGN